MRLDEHRLMVTKTASPGVVDLVERQTIDIGRVHPNQWNPNRQDLEIFRVLGESLKEEGFGEPVLVRPCATDGHDDYEVVNGEHRYRIMLELEALTLPVVIVDMDDISAKLAMLRRNRTRGGLDTIRVAKLLAEMRKRLSDDEIQQRLGYSPVELNELDAVLEAPFVAFGGGGAHASDDLFEIQVHGDLARWFDETLIMLSGRRASRFEGRASRKVRGMTNVVVLAEGGS